MNYYISDLYLFHRNVTRAGNNFDDRPFGNIDIVNGETVKLKIRLYKIT